MANSKIKLTYFDFTGKAETCRLILTYAGKEFEDYRVNKDNWPELKPSSPFGQVPYITIDGENFGQSVAIANYLAREFNLYGKTHRDGLCIDQFVQLIEDFIQEAAKSFREPDAEKKAEIEKKVREEAAPKYLGFAEKLLKKNNGEHFVGNDVTLADIVLFDVATGFLASFTKDVIGQFPLVKALVDKIGKNPRIKAYIENRK